MFVFNFGTLLVKRDLLLLHKPTTKGHREPLLFMILRIEDHLTDLRIGFRILRMLPGKVARF